MAGGTSGLNMIQSSKDNRSILNVRSKMADSPYAKQHVGIENRNPELYSELIEERFDRKSQSHRMSVIIHIVLTLLISVFFYFLIVG
ncbi:hypothetical protein ACFSKL_18985 [Belliella marina]|uniref:Uncharacterized protein n=1 Tax=Belliella marina TaxID=1644146 RepID=A0ABW4VU81_9BACT